MADVGDVLSQMGLMSLRSPSATRYDLLHKFMERDTADFLKNRKR